jgi:hypothetical protein
LLKIPVKMQRLLANERVRRFLPTFIHGLILVLLLVLFQDLYENHRDSLTVFIPPIGFSMLMFIFYGVQPLLVGIVNILIMHRLYNTRGWQVGFWLNGIFLLLVFATFNLVLETVLRLPFFYIALIHVLLLAFPFGLIAKFSNGCWNKPVD